MSSPNPAKPSVDEIASAARDPFNLQFNRLLRPNDDTLASRGGGKGLRIYDEIERDPHAFSVLQKRKMAVISRPWRIEPASNSLRDRKAAQAVEAQLKQINFDQICMDLLDALLKGYAVAEVLWRIAPDGIGIAAIKPRDARRFVFDIASQPRLITREAGLLGEVLPERKFIVHRYGAKDGNPYGLGLGTRLFWPVYFKRQGIQFWLTFADKFASPTAVGIYPGGTPPEQQDLLLDAISALSQDAGVTLPEGMKIEFLEAARSGTVQTYEGLCRYMDEEVSKAVLGETLSTSLGKGGGSYAAANTHNSVRLELVRADADLLSDTLNATLIRWLCEYNHPGAGAARVVRDCSEEEDLKQRAERDKVVFDMGFKPTLAYIRTTYGEGWEAAPPAATVKDSLPVQTQSTAAGQSAGELDGSDAAFAEGAPPSFAAPITAQLRRVAQKPMAHLLAQVQAQLDTAPDLHTLPAQLLDAFAEIDTADLAGVLAEALVLAQLSGMDEVKTP